MSITKEQEEYSQNIGKSYDNIPYVSYPFEYTRPENLKSIALLFGVKAPKLETARILELGCAEGGSLFRFASTYPKSYTLGVDLSKVEIEHGQEKIKKFGLKNLELKNMSITDLNDSYGKFDYIICHGVYSWVPDFVKKSILEVSKKLLNKNGVAFVSYNTLPGWNMVGTVRELMMYHANNFQTEQDKITQGKSVLNFLKDALGDAKTPHAKFMAEAANMMANKEDNYIRHEYLAEENKAFYFHEFIADAKKHDLEYLGDTDLHRMFIGNLAPNAAEKLGAINDIVKTEQYIDFIRNTQFRCTLLCHKDTNIIRNINYDRVKDLYIAVILNPELPETQELLTSNNPVKFFVNGSNDIHLTAGNPHLKAVMYTLAENKNNPMLIAEIINLAQKKVPNITKKDLEAFFVNEIARLIFSGYFKIFSDKPIFKYEISDKPKISDYALFEANLTRHNGRIWITNQINSMLNLTDYHVHALKLLDGKHTKAEIAQEIVQKIKDGVITAQENNQNITDEKRLNYVATEIVDQLLEYLKINYALIG